MVNQLKVKQTRGKQLGAKRSAVEQSAVKQSAVKQSVVNELTDKEKMEYVFRVREDEPEVEEWNRDVASQLAKQEGVELTDDCWNVVSFLRRYFEDAGSVDYARDLSAMLNQRYQDKGGLKFLFTIFPKGPVSQGCKIAGIPLPKDSKDNSFGTVA